MEPNPSCPGCQALLRRVAELERQVEDLMRLLDQLRRAGKRQAAPFSKQLPKPAPKTPGRKAGEDYGLKAFRQPPEQIDDEHDAALPPECPHCGGPVAEIEDASGNKLCFSGFVNV